MQIFCLTQQVQQQGDGDIDEKKEVLVDEAIMKEDVKDVLETADT